MKKSIEFSSKDGKHLFVICVDDISIHRLKKSDETIYEATVTYNDAIEIDESTFEHIRKVKLGL